MVSSDLLHASDRVLIVDDFLACGNAVFGLMDLVSQAGGEVVGVTAAIEKGYQGGGDKLRAQGVRVESLAVIDEMTEAGIRFRN
jgi:xanthine phosphoribosyltransferase